MKTLCGVALFCLSFFALASQLAERILDVASSPPEMEAVRTASIITIGRMNAVSQVKMLKKQAGSKIAPTHLD